MNGIHVRDLLARVADEVPATPVDPQPLLRRGYRRMARTAIVGALAVAAIVLATFAGFDAIRSAPVPLDGPTPSPAPVDGPLRANGEVLSFTGVPFETPGDLVAVNPETGEERVLVEDLEVVYSARWSADGSWVAYETGAPEGDRALWVVSASQGPHQVASGASIWVWSSTGAELATIRLTSPLHTDIAGSTLSTIDPVTREMTDVGTIPDQVGDVTSAPAWSPDGTRFVFGARGGAIHSVDARSGAPSLLIRLPGERLDSVDQIAWSPDGARIAIMNDLQPGGGRLYVVDADGSNVRVLVDDYDAMDVAWSPDGTRLAFADEQGRIWAASIDGSAPTEVGSLPLASCAFLCQRDLTWSPDGSRIAFRTAGDGSADVSAIDADGVGGAERINELTSRSWDGGWYSCECA